MSDYNLTDQSDLTDLSNFNRSIPITPFAKGELGLCSSIEGFKASNVKPDNVIS